MAIVIGKIYEETDYSKFKRLPGNRDVVATRIGKLTASLNSGYIKNPISVNEKMQIIDGQGRFEAMKSLGLPIHYYIIPKAGLEECQKLNKYNTTWKALDFAKSYASSGKKSYILLLQACAETNATINTILRITNHGSTKAKIDKRNSSSTEYSPFERGELEFTEKDLKKAKRVCNVVDDICESLLYSGRKNNALYAAATVMLEWCGDHYDHERMLKNCCYCRNTYAQMANTGDQLAELERIYNYNTKSTKSRVFFTDYMRNRGRNVRSYDNIYSPYKDKDVSSLKEETA